MHPSRSLSDEGAFSNTTFSRLKACASADVLSSVSGKVLLPTRHDARKTPRCPTLAGGRPTSAFQPTLARSHCPTTSGFFGRSYLSRPPCRSSLSLFKQPLCQEKKYAEIMYLIRRYCFIFNELYMYYFWEFAKRHIHGI